MKKIPKMLAVFLLLLTPTLTHARTQKLTVVAVSHSKTTEHYRVRVPESTDTHCIHFRYSVDCSSTTYGGGTQDQTVYHFTEIVNVNEGVDVMQYTLARVARWPWNSRDWLNDKESYAAEIKGKHMFIHYRQGGNQGKEAKLKFDIMDIRPAPKNQPGSPSSSTKRL